MTSRRWQFNLKRSLAATTLACTGACLLSDVPRLRCEPAQVLAYFLSAAVAGAGLGALLKRPCCGSLLGVVLAGPAIPPLAIVRRLIPITHPETRLRRNGLCCVPEVNASDFYVA